MSIKLLVVPVSLGDARTHVKAHHSHLPNVLGGKFAVGVSDGSRIVCVAIAGRPVARMLGLPNIIEVTRVASDGTAKNAASMCLAAITRAALALGYTRLVSYTGEHEDGTTYRACGWRRVHLSDGGEWGRTARDRHPSLWPVRKWRWEYGPDAMKGGDL